MRLADRPPNGGRDRVINLASPGGRLAREGRDSVNYRDEDAALNTAAFNYSASIGATATSVTSDCLFPPPLVVHRLIHSSRRGRHVTDRGG
ncbi:unnamed protein product, partial [Iphiclides podalirius]